MRDLWDGIRARCSARWTRQDPITVTRRDPPIFALQESVVDVAADPAYARAMKVDESEILAQISERGIQGLARLRLSEDLPVPDLGDWGNLESAPTRQLTDAEYAAYATVKR